MLCSKYVESGLMNTWSVLFCYILSFRPLSVYKGIVPPLLVESPKRAAKVRTCTVYNTIWYGDYYFMGLNDVENPEKGNVGGCMVSIDALCYDL